MLTPYVNSKFIEKIFTDESGRQFKLVFFVALIDGEVKGRLVSAKPVIQSFNQESFVCLPVYKQEVKFETKHILVFAPVVSPYFSLEFLLNSQPTRAPSRK